MTRTDELRERLLGTRPTDRLWGWVGPLLVAAIGGFLRFWQLGRPDSLVFDETYYVKQGWSLIRFGVEMRVEGKNEDADKLWNSGNVDVFSNQPDMMAHPPVGKWVIGAGEWLFGGPTNPFAWRVAVALLGTLSILILARVARRMFGSTLLGCIAGLLLAVEGTHLVMSRTGILDIIVSFFALVAFACLVVDRDRSRERLAQWAGSRSETGTDGIRTLTRGPWLGARPWRWAAGVALGLCIGTKWSGLFFLAVFGLMTVLWDLGARRAAGIRPWWREGLLKDGPYAFAQLVVTSAVVYVVSWTGWFLTDRGYHRQWDTFNPGQGIQWLPPVLRNWVKYHQDMWQFNTTLTTPHSYQSNPWGWMIQARPTSFFYEGTKRGEGSCTVDSCSAAVTTIGTVSVWWVGIVALLVCLFCWIARRDWRAGAALAGVVAGYGPWFMYQERTIFSFYSVAFEPYVVLAIVFCLGLVLGGRGASVSRRRWGAVVVGGYVLVTIALFAWFYPIYTGAVVPYEQWHRLMWFPSWI
ncbi:dolichyl-phosphate-mannose-protein mannosyltransferase [Knoellia remsis]|uniref:Polyprenol-phosphate-mannose--protein mannosyltransferase n=1 Tax=Knoellia remsis TaxID=407159 RepID=A0A2T0UJG7_9MICO|nr:phospholipid carrier-dependent glycosyltransferase [Knoellia remsis]PRY58080.1 dolichyl-phosphate-mannose-protein mannosyltransferase [Knoellia remsis]